MLELFSYQFFVHALIAGILISINCGYIGTYIVNRRIVFISGGISHASFGGVGIGYFLGINPIIGAAVFSLLTALGIESINQHSKLRRDTLIGMMWSMGMALGIIFIYLTPGYAPNLMTYLFGNILTVSTLDLFLLFSLTILIISVFKIFYKEILIISFDQDYARTQGIPTTMINYLMICLVALTIVFSIRTVGIILVISLLTIPQATASLLSKKFKGIIFYAVLFAFISSMAGLFTSYFLKIPSGATIIFMAMSLYGIFKIFYALKMKKNQQPV